MFPSLSIVGLKKVNPTPSGVLSASAATASTAPVGDQRRIPDSGGHEARNVTSPLPFIDRLNLTNTPPPGSGRPSTAIGQSVSGKQRIEEDRNSPSMVSSKRSRA